ncbi:PadR family transcriptional regulator [Allorhizocola rhizosphaerae]|uniref:PadR family transcriptional regulator n=1 Tax=Allorhizocola rhizosphaerae TaxID=1872709 RepID=UPI000E3C54B7|nr:PadR family transcriptional regulator [Allorhizocola rhizosphaerae]
MSTPYVLLGLLARGPRHGYELKREHDARLPRTKPVAFGQVYATLGRLTRDGLIQEAGQDRGGGPDRTAYALTEAGRAALAEWLGSVEPPAPHVQSALLAKVVVALFGSDDARAARRYLAAQREAHLARMRELTKTKSGEEASIADIVAADYAIRHLDADLRWMETTLDRVEAFHREVSHD